MSSAKKDRNIVRFPTYDPQSKEIEQLKNIVSQQQWDIVEFNKNFPLPVLPAPPTPPPILDIDLSESIEEIGTAPVSFGDFYLDYNGTLGFGNNIFVGQTSYPYRYDNLGIYGSPPRGAPIVISDFFNNRVVLDSNSFGDTQPTSFKIIHNRIYAASQYDFKFFNGTNWQGFNKPDMSSDATVYYGKISKDSTLNRYYIPAAMKSNSGSSASLRIYIGVIEEATVSWHLMQSIQNFVTASTRFPTFDPSETFSELSMFNAVVKDGNFYGAYGKITFNIFGFKFDTTTMQTTNNSYVVFSGSSPVDLSANVDKHAVFTAIAAGDIDFNGRLVVQSRITRDINGNIDDLFITTDNRFITIFDVENKAIYTREWVDQSILSTSNSTPRGSVVCLDNGRLLVTAREFGNRMTIWSLNIPATIPSSTQLKATKINLFTDPRSTSYAEGFQRVDPTNPNIITFATTAGSTTQSGSYLYRALFAPS